MLEAIARPWWRQRFELLDHLECLKSRRLRLDEIVVAGVAYGSPATQLPLDRVVAAHVAPLDATEHSPLYGVQFESERDRQPSDLTDRVVRAINGDGVLMLREHVGVALRGGEVRGIEIYRPALAHFCYIRSYVELLEQFGLPKAVKTRHVDGSPAEHTLFYPKINKQLVWDRRDNALSVVRLGDFLERPQNRQPPRGKRRFRLPRLPRGMIYPVPGPPLGNWPRHAT